MTGTSISRRRALVLLAASAGLAACGQDGRAILKVASQKGGTKALMLSSGALAGADYDVEWSEFPAAQNLLEAVGSGAVDVGLAGDAPFQFAYQSDSPVRAVSAQRAEPRPREAIGVVVPGASAARTMTDLRGKQVATTRGSIGHYLALRAIEAAGLPPDSVRFVFLSPGDAKAAFSSGAVDAWAVWVPYLTTAIQEGGRVIADGHDLTVGYGFDVANDTAIATKRALLVDFLRREGDALRWAAAHPDAYARVLAAETGLPPAIARIMVDKNRRLPVAIDARVVADQQIVLDTLRRAGLIRRPRSIDEAFRAI